MLDPEPKLESQGKQSFGLNYSIMIGMSRESLLKRKSQNKKEL